MRADGGDELPGYPRGRVGVAKQPCAGRAGQPAGRLVREDDRVAGVTAGEQVWPSRRRWFLQVADVHQARELVDLLLTAIDEGDLDSGDRDLGHTLHQLAARQPAWAAEVIAALVRRAGALPDTDNPFHPTGRHRTSRDLADETRAIAAAAPRQFVDLLLPHLLGLMHTHERPDWSNTELVADALWSHHIYGPHGALSDNVYEAMGDTLAAVASADPAHAATVFATLRAEPHEAARAEHRRPGAVGLEDGEPAWVAAYRLPQPVVERRLRVLGERP